MTTKSSFVVMTAPGLPGLAASARDRPRTRSCGIPEESPACARREGAHIDDRFPTVVGDRVLDALRDVKRLPGEDPQLPIPHAALALPLQHEHEFFRRRVPV